MSLNLKELAISILLPAIKEIGTAEIEDVLAGVKSHNTPEVYANTLKSIHSSFTLLKEATQKTKTKIDDGIVDLILAAVESAASDDDIEL